MGEEMTKEAKPHGTVEVDVRPAPGSFEPNLSTELGAKEFLTRLKTMSEPEARKPVKDALALSGLRYYVVYAGLAAFLLVVVIFSILYKLGPAGGYDTRWIIPQGLRLLLTIMMLEYICASLVWAYRGIVGGKFTELPFSQQIDRSLSGEVGTERAAEVTLKGCSIELKYLIDTLNDRVGTLNQAMSYLIPTLVAVQVLSLLLTGEDDRTSISVAMFGATTLAGLIALVFTLPIRFIAHSRVSRYRAWLRRVETALLSPAESGDKYTP